MFFLKNLFFKKHSEFPQNIIFNLWEKTLKVDFHGVNYLSNAMQKNFSSKVNSD